MSPILSARGGLSAGAYGWGALSAAGGAFESIATVSLSNSSSASFTSIPSTFKHLQIRFAATTASSGSVLYGQINNDYTSANYAVHSLKANGTAASAVGYTSYGSTLYLGFANGTVSTYPNVGIIDILDYASTTKNKTIRSIYAADNNSTGGSIEINSCLWISTSAITSLQFAFGSNATGSLALYGIKESA